MSSSIQDRIYIDKNRQGEIRNIKNTGFLNFDNQKDVFLFAMAMGLNIYSGGMLNCSKDGLFNTRDFSEADKAFIISLIFPELDKIEDIVDYDLILKKAEGMADKGFYMLLDEIKNKSKEVFLLDILNKTNELFEEAKEKKYLDI